MLNYIEHRSVIWSTVRSKSCRSTVYRLSPTHKNNARPRHSIRRQLTDFKTSTSPKLIGFIKFQCDCRVSNDLLCQPTVFSANRKQKSLTVRPINLSQNPTKHREGRFFPLLVFTKACLNEQSQFNLLLMSKRNFFLI